MKIKNWFKKIRKNDERLNTLVKASYEKYLDPKIKVEEEFKPIRLNDGTELNPEQVKKITNLTIKVLDYVKKKWDENGRRFPVHITIIDRYDRPSTWDEKLREKNKDFVDIEYTIYNYAIDGEICIMSNLQGNGVDWAPRSQYNKRDISDMLYDLNIDGVIRYIEGLKKSYPKIDKYFASHRKEIAIKQKKLNEVVGRIQ